MKRFHGMSAAMIAASMLGACGGGDEDNTPYAANAAWADLLDSASTWPLAGSGSSAGQNVSIDATLSFSLLADGTFAGTGETGKIRKLTTSVSVNLQSTSSSDTTYYLNASNGFIGNVGSDGSCSVPTNIGLPPTSATVGSSGPLATWTEYSSCDDSGVKTGTNTSTWSIEKVSSQVFFCSNDVYTSVSGSQTSTQKQCFDISKTGTLMGHAKLSIVATDNGVSTTVTLNTPLTPV